MNEYCHLRYVQTAAYELYARRFNLTAKELFVLDIIWFAPDGCLQSEISERLSATKQTINAIIKKFWKQGYVSLTESDTDRRNKVIRFTDAGMEYVGKIIPPAVSAEMDAMGELTNTDIAEMVRITTVFSNHMKDKFAEAQGENSFVSASASLQQKMYADAMPKQHSMPAKSGCVILPFFRGGSRPYHASSISFLNFFASVWCCIENIFLAAAAEGLAYSMHIPVESTHHFGRW